MSDLGNVCMAVIICWTIRSVFFRWADHIEQCAKHRRTSEPDVARELDRSARR